MKMAMGMVAPMVKMPQALSASAFNIAMPRPARAMIRMNRIAMTAVAPATVLISVRAMSASDRPPRRVEAQRISMSCTAPARHTPVSSQMRPGA